MAVDPAYISRPGHDFAHFHPAPPPVLGTDYLPAVTGSGFGDLGWPPAQGNGVPRYQTGDTDEASGNDEVGPLPSSGKKSGEKEVKRRSSKACASDRQVFPVGRRALTGRQATTAESASANAPGRRSPTAPCPRPGHAKTASPPERTARSAAPPASGPFQLSNAGTRADPKAESVVRQRDTSRPSSRGCTGWRPCSAVCSRAPTRERRRS